MKVLKLIWGLALLAALVAVIQLVEPPKNSPVSAFARLPDVRLTEIAEAEALAGRYDAAMLLLDYVIENDLPEKTQGAALRQQYLTQATADKNPVVRLQAVGLTARPVAGNAFDSLASATVADAILHGEWAQSKIFDAGQDDLVVALNGISGITAVFPPAEWALTLTKAAKHTGALNMALTAHLGQVLAAIQPDPKSAVAVEQFRENFMPLLELARRCRTWAEFQVILREADSPEQVKVLTKIVSASSATSKRLAQVLTLAATDGRATVSACLDDIMQQGQAGLDALYNSMAKGAAGLKFAAAHPTVTAQALRGSKAAQLTGFAAWQERYQSARREHGAIISALKYLVIAILCALLLLAVIPARYLGRLLASAGATSRTAAEPSATHSVFSALAVGVVLSGFAYVFSMAMHTTPEPVASPTAMAAGSASVATRSDSALLSGTVVLLSLLTHAVIWFYVRNKLKQVEDDRDAEPAFRLKRLENMDVFLDLPLFTGLALTVIAFILITLDAGMSRHFAYTSTVVGILSAVSLRIRYLYPLKEQLLRVS